MHLRAILTEPLLAPTLRKRTTMASTIITAPQSSISRMSFCGAMSSIMYSRMYGRSSSSAVAANLTNITRIIAQMCFFMYDQMNFIKVIMS